MYLGGVIHVGAGQLYHSDSHAMHMQMTRDTVSANTESGSSQGCKPRYPIKAITQSLSVEARASTLGYPAAVSESCVVLVLRAHTGMETLNVLYGGV